MRKRAVHLAVVALVAAVVGWRAFRPATADDYERFVRLQQEVADLREQLRAAPPGSDERRALAERFRRANRAGADLLLKHPEWRPRLDVP